MRLLWVYLVLVAVAIEASTVPGIVNSGSLSLVTPNTEDSSTNVDEFNLFGYIKSDHPLQGFNLVADHEHMTLAFCTGACTGKHFAAMFNTYDPPILSSNLN